MMQAQTLPISVNSAGPAPAAAAARGQSGNGAPENTPFGQTLSREIEQRQQARSQAPAPAPQQQAKPAQAQAGRNESKAPAKAAEGTAKQERAEAGDAAEAQAASGSSPAGAAEADEAAASAVESAAVTPVTDMLALVASMAAPAVAAPIEGDPAAAVTADPAAAGAALAAAIAPVAPLAGAEVLATAVTVAPAAGLAVAHDNATPGSTAIPETAQEAGGMFVGALAQAAQGNRAQQAAQQGAPAGAAPQQDGAALAALTERIADSAAAATPSAQETSFVSQVQAARLEQVQANPLAAGDRLPARVGTPAWDRQLGQKIVWMVAGADQSATLTLNPPDLGPVQVVLNVTNDQATVNFTSAQPEVRQALETAMPKLREMMGESGITLGSATVNAGMPEQQQQAQRENDARNGNGGGNGRGLNEAGGEGNAPAAPVRRTALPGQVDTFA
ncbi:MAG TPA: flagellar hook-length control protein FliK [Telluria sp.]|nr:flagellar hook-length control protein FliK [Telluria sp.]